MGISSSHPPRHPPHHPASTGRPSRPAAPLPADFLARMQEKGMAGEDKLQLPGTPGYLANCVCWNRDAIGSPSAIFRPQDEKELAEFIKMYSQNPLPAPHSLSIAGGRHSHYGLKNDALLIDMSHSFRALSVDAERMVGRFGSGLKLADVDAACAQKGVATTLGTNPDTGVAGLTLGGGFGWLARRHGMSVDNLLSVRMVLASGEIVVASEREEDKEHRELFWAIRGGGGNFGIVTEFEFRVHKRGPVLKGASVFLTRKLTDVPSVLRSWAAYVATAPENVQCNLVLPAGGPMILPYAYVGDDVSPGGEGERMLAPLRAIGGAWIRPHGVTPYSYTSADRMNGKDLQSSALASQPPCNAYEAGITLGEMNDAVIDILLRYTGPVVRGGIVPNKKCSIIIFAMGGAVSRVSPLDTALGTRYAQYVCLVLGVWDDQPGDEAAYMRERGKVQKWVRGVVQELCKGRHSPGMYNVLGADAPPAASVSAPASSSDEKKEHEEAAKAVLYSAAEEEPSQAPGAEGAAAVVTAGASPSAPGEVVPVSPAVVSDPAASAASASASSAKPTPDSSLNPTPAAHSALVSAHGPVGLGAVKSMYGFSPSAYARLARVKARYDAANLFRNNNNIQPMAPADAIKVEA